jgi:hypothetical protein
MRGKGILLRRVVLRERHETYDRPARPLVCGLDCVGRWCGTPSSDSDDIVVTAIENDGFPIDLPLPAGGASCLPRWQQGRVGRLLQAMEPFAEAEDARRSWRERMTLAIDLNKAFLVLGL